MQIGKICAGSMEKVDMHESSNSTMINFIDAILLGHTRPCKKRMIFMFESGETPRMTILLPNIGSATMMTESTKSMWCTNASELFADLRRILGCFMCRFGFRASRVFGLVWQCLSSLVVRFGVFTAALCYGIFWGTFAFLRLS